MRERTTPERQMLQTETGRWGKIKNEIDPPWRIIMDESPVLPLILEERCTGCSDCVEVCPAEALELADGRAVLARPEDCAYCADCEEICPEGAIALPFEIAFENRT